MLDTLSQLNKDKFQDRSSEDIRRYPNKSVSMLFPHIIFL